VIREDFLEEVPFNWDLMDKAPIILKGDSTGYYKAEDITITDQHELYS
jgi:hypothetical protein